MALSLSAAAGPWLWRRLLAADLPRVRAIAKEAFPDHPEDAERFAERLQRGGPFCFGLEDEEGALQGYVLACPLKDGLPAPLNAPLAAASDQDAWLFIHDLALCDAARGRGCGRGVVRRLTALAEAHALEGMALVAVNGSAGFWSAEGFAPAPPPNPEAHAALASYGAEALYMSRRKPRGRRRAGA